MQYRERIQTKYKLYYYYRDSSCNIKFRKLCKIKYYYSIGTAQLQVCTRKVLGYNYFPDKLYCI